MSGVRSSWPASAVSGARRRGPARSRPPRPRGGRAWRSSMRDVIDLLGAGGVTRVVRSRVVLTLAALSRSRCSGRRARTVRSGRRGAGDQPRERREPDDPAQVAVAAERPAASATASRPCARGRTVRRGRASAHPTGRGRDGPSPFAAGTGTPGARRSSKTLRRGARAARRACPARSRAGSGPLGEPRRGDRAAGRGSEPIGGGAQLASSAARSRRADLGDRDERDRGQHDRGGEVTSSVTRPPSVLTAARSRRRGPSGGSAGGHPPRACGAGSRRTRRPRCRRPPSRSPRPARAAGGG